MLRQMEGIDQVAVIGVPDERLGEVGKACIIRQRGATITADWGRAGSRVGFETASLAILAISANDGRFFGDTADNLLGKRGIGEGA